MTAPLSTLIADRARLAEVPASRRRSLFGPVLRVVASVGGSNLLGLLGLALIVAAVALLAGPRWGLLTLGCTLLALAVLLQADDALTPRRAASAASRASKPPSQ